MDPKAPLLPPGEGAVTAITSSQASAPAPLDTSTPVKIGTPIHVMLWNGGAFKPAFPASTAPESEGSPASAAPSRPPLDADLVEALQQPLVRPPEIREAEYRALVERYRPSTPIAPSAYEVRPVDAGSMVKAAAYRVLAELADDGISDGALEDVETAVVAVAWCGGQGVRPRTLLAAGAVLRIVADAIRSDEGMDARLIPFLRHLRNAAIGPDGEVLHARL